MKILFMSLLLIPVSLFGKTYIPSNYCGYLIDLAVVITGVTAAFLLNSAWDKIKRNQLEKKYLASFLNDIESDLKLAQETVESNKQKSDRSKAFIELIKTDSHSADKALEIFQDIATINQFAPKMTTYISIVNSGNLSIMRDFELKEKLIHYYKSFEEIKLKEKISNDFIFNTAIPYMYKNVDLLNHKIIDPDIIRENDFKNIFLGYFALSGQLLEAYETLKESNEKISACLKKSIK